MTPSEWQASADPSEMIRWLVERGHVEPLWGFTIGCCRRVWADLPGDAFRRVVEHFEQIGPHDIDDVLSAAYQAIDKLERRFRKAEDDQQGRLSRQIGFGRMVFAFDHQDAGEAARSISQNLLEWADDSNAERQEQAVLLRQLVRDPSEPVAGEDES